MLCSEEAEQGVQCCASSMKLRPDVVLLLMSCNSASRWALSGSRERAVRLMPSTAMKPFANMYFIQRGSTFNKKSLTSCQSYDCCK